MMTQVGPLRECPGPDVVYTDVLLLFLLQLLLPWWFVPPCPLYGCFICTWKRSLSWLFSIVEGILLNFSTTLFKKKFLLTTSLHYKWTRCTSCCQVCFLRSQTIYHHLLSVISVQDFERLDHVQLVSPFIQGCDAQLLQPFFIGSAL